MYPAGWELRLAPQWEVCRKSGVHLDHLPALAEHLFERKRRQVDAEVALNHNDRAVDARPKDLDTRERAKQRPAGKRQAAKAVTAVAGFVCA